MPHRALLLLLLLTSSLALAACGGKGGARSEPAELSGTQHVRMAHSLLRAGRTSEALAHVDQAVAREPDNATLHHLRGQIYFQTGRLDEAERAFRRVLELDPLFSDAHNFLGVVYTEQRRYAEAEQELRTTLADAAYPTPELAQLNLGLLYAEQGRDDDALRSYRQAVEINPKYYKAHYELAATLDRLGRLDEAARQYEVAAAGYRTSADYHYRLGLTYFRLGRKLEAREPLQRAVDLAPGSESAVLAQELLGMIE
jgi:Tfp pilus assembly protein PilF